MTILDDKRIIESICWNNAEDAHYSIKDGHEIKAYGEPGMHCDIPFVEVRKDGVIIARVPAWQVSVHYKQDVPTVKEIP